MRISDWSADVCSYDLEREEVPAVLEKQAVSALGDLWEMNGHRLICGDALDGRIYDQLMEGEKAHAVFTDQPYGCGIDGFVAGKGQPREFVMGSGDMSDRKSVVSGKSVSVRGDLGGRLIIKKKEKRKNNSV